ncbi:tetratricopeptide repeat protein [Sphingobium sp. H39-3-25]|uniref:tetratricopeptide repeat protein n=1 Tax=Sphingobium arseniciresistens TaxID=3030834 RepID=UPI0023B967DA|nr:tetratricopeptide repeat protein [Sphingobium arseniciresistens]
MRWRVAALALAALPGFMAALALATEPTAAEAPAPVSVTHAQDDITAAEEAIDAGRMVQASLLLSRIGADMTVRQSPRYQVASAQLALGEDQAPEVVARLEPLLASGDTSCRLLQTLGSGYLRTGRDTDALAALERAVAACPNQWQAWEALGMAHDRQAAWKESAAAFETAFRLTDRPARVANNYGMSLLHQNRATEAANLFAEAARLDGTNPRYRINEDAARTVAGLPLRDLGENETSAVTASRLANASRAARQAGQDAEARLLSAQALTTAEYYGATDGLDLLAKDGSR